MASENRVPLLKDQPSGCGLHRTIICDMCFNLGEALFLVLLRDGFEILPAPIRVGPSVHKVALDAQHFERKPAPKSLFVVWYRRYWIKKRPGKVTERLDRAVLTGKDNAFPFMATAILANGHRLVQVARCASPRFWWNRHWPKVIPGI